MEKHELSKVDFELIDDAFKALVQSGADPVVADKIADLRDKFRDAFTGWLEIEESLVFFRAPGLCAALARDNLGRV